MNWIEVRLRPDVRPRAFYDWLAERNLAMGMHHFWDEPWWEGAYVVRMPRADVEDCPLVDHVVVWDSQPDEEAYGAAWKWTRAFFEASSVLSTFQFDERADDFRARLVHCLLNSHGLSQRDEARFAMRFLWGRLTVGIRWRLYLRRRWEREQGPPVKEPA